MGTRIRLGKGFTIGASGLRWGHSVPGVPRSYFSTGRSGTLLVGGRLRHWEPNRRPTATRGTAPRCQGLTRAGNQCANTASLVPVDDPRPPRARHALTCAVHQGQCAALASAEAAQPPTSAPPTSTSQHRPGSRADRNHEQWRRLGVPPWLQCILVLGTFTLVIFVFVAAFAQQAGYHRADRAAGLAAAAAAGAPGICISDSPSADRPGFSAQNHWSWTISATGTCDPDLMVHFEPVTS